MIILPTYQQAALWIGLGIAVIALLTGSRAAWLMFCLSLGYAFILSRISLIGALSVAAGFAFALAVSPHLPERFGKFRSVPMKFLLHAGLVAWCAAMALHVMPGFKNLLVLDAVTSGPASAPFTLYFNLDKPLIIFAVFLAYPSMLDTRPAGEYDSLHDRTDAGARQLVILASVFGLMIVLALLSSTIRPEFSLPEWWWIFALNNLVFTCVAEEVFFRGYVQNSFASITNQWTGIGIASILFGIVHFPSGPVIVLFTCLAGLLYGLTYHFSGRLVAAIGMHFSVNIIHLLFFTYPVAAR